MTRLIELWRRFAGPLLTRASANPRQVALIGAGAGVIVVVLAAIWFVVSSGLLVRRTPDTEAKGPETTAPAPGVPKLAWVDCWFTRDAARPERCARVSVAVRRNDPKSGTIELGAVVFPAPRAGETPVIMIAGGPGEPAGLDAELIDRWRHKITGAPWMRDRDVVIFDMRGTGLSQPDMRCGEITAAGMEILVGAPAPGEETRLWRDAASACRARLGAAGIDPDAYTTQTIAEDLRDLIATLGYPRWTLFGISYGTRIVLTFLAQDPGHTTAVILDSVYPPNVAAYAEGAVNARDAFNQMFSDCERDRLCRSSFPNLSAAFRRVVAKAKEKPLEIALRGQGDQPAQKILVDDAKLVEMLFYGFYAWNDLAEVPGTIAALDRGDLNAFTPLVERTRDFYRWDNSSHGLFLAVECHDEFPANSPEAIERAVAATPQFKSFALSNLALQACPGWGVPRTAARLPMPADPRIPVLILSGGLDPVTPPRWARAVATQWPQATLFVFPGVGHGVLRNHACADLLVARFLAEPGVKPSHTCFAAVATAPYKYPIGRR